MLPSVSIVTPGLWLYVESVRMLQSLCRLLMPGVAQLGHDYRYLGYAFAAPIIGGYLCGNALKPSSLENVRGSICQPQAHWWHGRGLNQK